MVSAATSSYKFSESELEAAINYPDPEIAELIARSRKLSPWLFAQVLAHPKFSVEMIGDKGTGAVDQASLDKLLDSRAGKALTPQELIQATVMAAELIGERTHFYLPPKPRRRFRLW